MTLDETDTQVMAEIRAATTALLQRQRRAAQRAIYVGATGAIVLDVWIESVVLFVAEEVDAGAISLNGVKRALVHLGRAERINLPSIAEILHLAREASA